MDQITYAKSKGAPAFDWNSFLNKEIVQHTLTEMQEAGVMAGSWVTCACGNQCEIIPRYNDGTPKDNILFGRGHDFYVYVVGMGHAHAEHNTEAFNKFRRKAHLALQEIEGRSAELIKEINDVKK